MTINRNGTISNPPVDTYVILHPNGLSIINIALVDAAFAATQGWLRAAALPTSATAAGQTPGIGWTRPTAASPWQPPS